MTDKKNGLANNIVSELCEYETVVIQDEQFAKRQKNGHGKKVRHSIPGRAKPKLNTESNVVVLDKYVPTANVCIECGCCRNELKVGDRTFRCDCCVEMDRDVHAAQNMVWFYENDAGAERAEAKRAEMQEKILDAIRHSKQTASLNREDSAI